MRPKLIILSPLMFLVLAIAWPVTLHQPVCIALYRGAGKPVSVELGRGEIYLVASNVPLGTDVEWSFACNWFSDTPSLRTIGADQGKLEFLDSKHGTKNLYYGKNTNVLSEPNWGYFVIAAPIWSVMLVPILIGAPAIFSEYRRVHRPRVGQCQKCGYDLRATPERCPECGTASTRRII